MTAAEATARRQVRPASVAVLVLGIELLVLLATGIALLFLYRPSGGGAGLGGITIAPDIRGVRLLVGVHRLVGQLAVPTSIVAAVLAVVPIDEPWSAGPGLRRALRAGGTVVAVLVASFTGFLLPWDQLALWAVTVGSDYRGYTWILGDEVRYVLLGGVEIGTDSLRRWLVIHLLVGAAALGMVELMRRALTRPRPRGSSADR